ncbi:MAG TPA: DUF2946 family protein [Luteimonas sp.]
MNAQAFQVRLGWLAVLAVLLLAVVPTAGRLVHVSAGHGHADAGHAMHAPDGRHAAAMRGALAFSTDVRDVVDPASPGAPRPAPGDADCDYCPLLASLLATAVPGVLSTGTLRHGFATSIPAAPRRPWLHPCGLGSRGPPLFG